MRRTIAISLSPNTFKKDVLLSARLLFSPWRWQKGRNIEKLERAFKKYFEVKYAVSFNSGRSAEYAILKAANIKNGDEILIQAFTCVVVPNSILWLGAKPVYIDFGKNSLNMDPVDLERKITSQSKAIIVQHTFGKPALIEQIKKIAKKNKLLLIEDCAHSLGASFQDKKLGTYGEATFFSFGRDKVISSVFGGMAITNNQRIGKNLLKIQQETNFPSHFWVFQQLLHPIAFNLLILPLYNFFNLGKIILVCLQKLGLLSRAVSHQEKNTEQPRNYPTKLPNAQATLALSQFQRLAKFNQKREKISEIYRRELKKEVKSLPPIPGEIYMRYTIISKRAKELLNYAKKKGVVLGDWYQNIIDPRGVDFTKAGYSKGSCPVAEKMAKQVVNLPTYPRMEPRDAQQVIGVIKEFFREK